MSGHEWPMDIGDAGADLAELWRAGETERVADRCIEAFDELDTPTALAICLELVRRLGLDDAGVLRGYIMRLVTS